MPSSNRGIDPSTSEARSSSQSVSTTHRSGNGIRLDSSLNKRTRDDSGILLHQLIELSANSRLGVGQPDSSAWTQSTAMSMQHRTSSSTSNASIGDPNSSSSLGRTTRNGKLKRNDRSSFSERLARIASNCSSNLFTRELREARRIRRLAWLEECPDICGNSPAPLSRGRTIITGCSSDPNLVRPLAPPRGRLRAFRTACRSRGSPWRVWRPGCRRPWGLSRCCGA